MKIQIHPAFAGYLACTAILSSSWKKTLAVLYALIVHEAGHCLISFLLGEQICSIELTPFGGVIHYASGKSPCKGVKGLCVAAAGPMSNYLSLLIISAYTPFQSLLGESLSRSVAVANLSMMLLNLLPAFPLDGGRIVFSLGFFLFPASRLISFLSLLGVAAGIALSTVAFVGLFFYQTLNCSLLLIGGYIIVCASKSRRQLLSENLFTVLHERLADETDTVCQIQVYHVPPGTRLTDLLLPLESSSHAIFLYEQGGKRCIISDQQICQRLMENPTEELDLQLAREIEENN